MLLPPFWAKRPAVWFAQAKAQFFLAGISNEMTKFLVDTGSDLCVYPRRLIPRRKERVDYDLCAANGTTIHTSGWLSLSLNLDLRRDFTWLFVVADVTHPIIGVDFLYHFCLLVDCRNNRLLDGVT
jgi:predicted aspartyl protease